MKFPVLMSIIILMSLCGCNDGSLTADEIKAVRHKFSCYTDTANGEVMFNDLDIRSLDACQLTEKYGVSLDDTDHEFHNGKYKDSNENIYRFGRFNMKEILGNYSFVKIYVRNWIVAPKWCLTCYCIKQKGDKCLKPVWGELFKFSPDWIPFWALPEKDLTPAEIAKIYGKPERATRDTFYYGNTSSKIEVDEIDDLKEVQEAIVDTYDWAVDSIRVLRMFYPADAENKRSSRAIWGYQTHPQYWCLE